MHTTSVVPAVNHAFAVREMSQREPGEDRIFMIEKTAGNRAML
jgi:hypothetical protein